MFATVACHPKHTAPLLGVLSLLIFVLAVTVPETARAVQLQSPCKRVKLEAHETDEANCWTYQHALGPAARAPSAPSGTAAAIMQHNKHRHKVKSWSKQPRHGVFIDDNHRQVSRRVLHTAGQPVGDTHNSDNAALNDWIQRSQQYSKRAASGGCFAEFPGFIAKDITDFVRLIKDPAASHIELRGDIVFTPELFPPENAHNKSNGINVTHQVEIRACTDVQTPIIVDVNNLLQQIYVYGNMTWQGSIKFINSYPSPRRGGMFPLISILSVEGNGSISFTGLQIHGNEPSPLFNPGDPYWEVYQNDSSFAPQPSMYTRINTSAMIMHKWMFYKTAWVLRSQGYRGIVRPDGDSFWVWRDVLIAWSWPPGHTRGGLQGAAFVAAIVVPVVCGALLLAAGAVLAWWSCKKRLHRSRSISTVDDKSLTRENGAYRGNSASGGPPSHIFTAASEEISRAGRCSSSSTTTTQLIEQARRRMQDWSMTRDASIVLEGLLGEGTFGKVYSATWKGSPVAVKTMLLPAAMSNKERREKMAIMETAISSSLSHPNIVTTYTYEVKPLTAELARKALEPKSFTTNESVVTFLDDTTRSSDHHGWELRLVLEMCDVGNLKDFLSRGGFKQAAGDLDMVAIVATALDVARAMLHLHSENIIHSDLKARNVLLKSAGSEVRGFVAKVSDFGLSMRIDPSDTHISNVYQGTLTHMAPEVLMFGKISFASDVYAFGIILWEMFTAQLAFKGVPRALLGHEVTKMGRRPEFPSDCPFEYQLLACRCWESDPAIRPSFGQILDDLERMTSKLQIKRMESFSSMRHDASPHTAAASGTSGRAAVAFAGLQLPAGPTQLDAAKYHHWEPQTSLLGSRSTTSSASSNHCSHPAQQQQQQQQKGEKLPTPAAAPNVNGGVSPVVRSNAARAAAADGGEVSGSAHAVSLGTWDAPSGDGLWLSGSLAPVELPAELQLGFKKTQQGAVPHLHMPSDQLTAAAAGLPLNQQPAAAAAAVSTQQSAPAAAMSQQQQQEEQQHHHHQLQLQAVSSQLGAPLRDSQPAKWHKACQQGCSEWPNSRASSTQGNGLLKGGAAAIDCSHKPVVQADTSKANNTYSSVHAVQA